MNVHADGPKFWSLGLVRVWGSMPSEKCIELLRCRLTAFGPNLDTDIVAICTDGASVMCRVGKLLSAEHQQCIVHGIHLAVQDVLYKATSESTLPADGASASGCSTATALTAAVEDEINRGDSDSEDDVEEVGLDVELTCSSSSAKDHHHTDEQTQEVQEEMTLTLECDADDECFQVQEDADDIGYNLSELSPEYRKTVAKVRKTVKLFGKSPTKNDSVLQKNVAVQKNVAEYDHEINLILDCPTRWKSSSHVTSFLGPSSLHPESHDIDIKATPALGCIKPPYS